MNEWGRWAVFASWLMLAFALMWWVLVVLPNSVKESAIPPVPTLTAEAQAVAAAAVTTVVDNIVALATSGSALLIALIGWFVQRRDDKDRIRHLEEQNMALVEALRMSVQAGQRP